MQNFIELTIDRTSLGQSALVVASDLSTDLTITSYTEPAIARDVRYAPASDFINGEVALSWRYATTGLAFTVGASDPATEAAARAAIEELSDALARLSYDLTETIGDAVRTWSCLPGSITPTQARTYRDLRTHRPLWQINIPAYPIPA